MDMLSECESFHLAESGYNSTPRWKLWGPLAHCTIWTYLVAVAEHGGEDVLQQGQDMFIGLEQTPHRLEPRHAVVGALSN